MFNSSLATNFTCPLTGIENWQEGEKQEVDLCNGLTDCFDGSDELNEICCTDSSFTCQESGKCINSKYKCDGFSDCGDEDGSDEQNCPACPAAGRIKLFECIFQGKEYS